MFSPWMGWAAIGLIGACVGSFLSVIAARVFDPRPSFFSTTRSVGPPCGRLIRARDNSPASRLGLLRGRRRGRPAAVPSTYPIVELAGAAVFLLSVRRFGITWSALAASVFGWILVLIAACDWREQLIPWRFPVGGVLLLLGWALHVGGIPLAGPALLDGLLVAAALAAVAFLVGWGVGRPFGSERSVMGEADVVVSLFLGAGVGFGQAVLAISYAALLGLVVFGVRAVPAAWKPIATALYGGAFLSGVFLGGNVFLGVQVFLLLAALPARNQDLAGEPVPFGTWMCAGALLVLVWPDPFAASLQGWLPWHSDWAPSALFTQ